ncbi:MAG: hypothetical protein QMD12_00660 [Candidatus Aenigmarchaeota archaeon]|nr:hypothetical protein [Candidatus Aenigmarchaeota archaeon]
MKGKVCLTLFLFFLSFLLLFFHGYETAKAGTDGNTCKIKGKALHTDSGALVSAGTITFIVKETGDRNSTTFTNGYFDLYCPPIDVSRNRFTIGIVVNSSNGKMGYNQLIVGTGSYAPQTQACSARQWHFRGYAVDSETGNLISQGNVTVGIKGKSETNKTGFSNGVWDIYFSPCLISGELYTFQFTITSENKKSYLFLNQVAK